MRPVRLDRFSTAGPLAQLDVGNGRVLPLIKFRGQVRPVLLAGTKSFVEKAIKEAEPYYMSLRERGVSGGRHRRGV